MQGIKAILIKEWKCFKGSDRGLFVFYCVLIISWSLFLAFREQPENVSDALWLVFFSVVVTANFSNTVFISERINGALEILLTSGFTRRAILTGKMLFILSLSIAMGGVCLVLGTLIRNVIQSGTEAISVWNFITFVGASFLNTSGAAYLSVRMSNPRLLHLANMFLLIILVSLYSFANCYIVVPQYTLVLVLFLIGSVVTLLAAHEFESERILRPIEL